MILENTLLRETGSLSRCIHAVIEVKFKSLNLRKGQSIYLTRICENPGITLMQLSRILTVDKTSAAKAVNKLIELGFAEKVRDRNDQRSFNLFPSEKALKAYNLIIAEENRMVEKCFTGFGRDEKTSVLEMIKRMKENIEDDWYGIKEYNR